MSVAQQRYAFNRNRKSFLAYDLTLADTHWTRLKGLLGTKAAAFVFGKGLWIIPCQGVHTLGMRYPIDVIYLSDSGTVLQVAENVQPWRITPILMHSASVLELPAHTVWSTGTEPGDLIEIGTVGLREDRDTACPRTASGELFPVPDGSEHSNRGA